MNQAANVGSVEPFEDRQLVVGVGLLNRLQRRLQIRPRSQRRIAIVFERLQIIVKSNGPVTSNWSTGVRSSSNWSS